MNPGIILEFYLTKFYFPYSGKILEISGLAWNLSLSF